MNLQVRNDEVVLFLIGNPLSIFEALLLTDGYQRMVLELLFQLGDFFLRVELVGDCDLQLGPLRFLILLVEDGLNELFRPGGVQADGFEGPHDVQIDVVEKTGGLLAEKLFVDGLLVDGLLFELFEEFEVEAL